MLLVFTQKHVGLENRAKVQHLKRDQIKEVLVFSPGFKWCVCPTCSAWEPLTDW